MEARLRCTSLSVGYEGRSVLTGVDIELVPGEVVALLGPNGGGKSTLLKTLSGLIPSIAGSVVVEGKPLDRLGAKDVAQRIAFVPQEEIWQFAFTVEEVVAMGRLPVSNGYFDTREDHEAAVAAMAMAGCLELRDRAVTELSGGEKQRVLIARALAQGCATIFLDEPTSHLDPQHQVAISTLIRQLATSGKSLLIAIHDLPTAAAMADRGLLVYGGKTSEMKELRTLLESPELEGAYGTRFERISGEDGRLLVFPKK